MYTKNTLHHIEQIRHPYISPSGGPGIGNNAGYSIAQIIIRIIRLDHCLGK